MNGLSLDIDQILQDSDLFLFKHPYDKKDKIELDSKFDWFLKGNKIYLSKIHL